MARPRRSGGGYLFAERKGEEGRKEKKEREGEGKKKEKDEDTARAAR